MTPITLITLYDENDTKKLAQKLADSKLCGSVWLSGDLGTGKTTLTRYWLQALGFVGAVKSPTYTLVEPYQISTAKGERLVYHADLYRLNDPEELDFIGFFEYFDEPDVLVIIEWASQAQSILPKPDVLIEITRQADGRRQVRIIGLNLDWS